MDRNELMKTIHHVVDMDCGQDAVWAAQDSVFRLRVAATGDGRPRLRLRFWQDYAVELADDYYGVYNFNWGYYLESLRLLCVEGVGKPFRPTGAY